jgi:hypothetical protein
MEIFERSNAEQLPTNIVTDEIAKKPVRQEKIRPKAVIPMPESSDLSLMTDRVGKGWFSMLCHGSELIGSGISSDSGPETRNRLQCA